MKIHNWKTIGEVKDIFQFIFPGLKLKFYRKLCGHYEGLIECSIADHTKPLYQISKRSKDSVLEFNFQDTVKDLVEKFKDVLGLNIQIFWASSDVCIGTTKIGNCTLSQLNDNSLLTNQKYLLNEY